MLESYVMLGRLIDLLDKVRGRKKLQKIVYLSKQIGVPFSHDFDYHFYGPFSEALANELEEMKWLGLVDEEKTQTPGGFNQYTYHLSQKGRKLLDAHPDSCTELMPFKEIIQGLNKFDARDLELKATLYFLLQSGFSSAEATKEVKELKAEQDYQDDEIEQSLVYLESFTRNNQPNAFGNQI